MAPPRPGVRPALRRDPEALPRRQYRPHWTAPNVDGLWFASETFKSRGVGTDRAARAAVTVVEEILGRRLSTFGDGWRY